MVRRSHSPVTIVHERFTEYGGSERVVEALHQMWPDAPVCAPIADRQNLPPGLGDADIRTDFLQHLYRGGRTYAHLLPLMPAAMRRIDLRGVDVVITSHHAFSNRVQPDSGAALVSYTHTPARWMWDPRMLTNETGGRAGRAALRAYAATQRARDVAAARRVDLLVVNSRYVGRRAADWWGRDDTVVVHPPVDVDFFTPDPETPREDFFLMAGRLVPYKRPEVAVLAARRAGARLVVVGAGRARELLDPLAAPGIEFLGSVDRLRLRDLLRRCRALVFPGVEDFGIVPVEAQACGTAVIGLRAGGALESVVEGTTGVLYEPGGDEVDALSDALRSFRPDEFDPAAIRRHAEGFSPGVFRTRFLAAVGSVVDLGRLATAER